MTLPAMPDENRKHEVGFPFNIRTSLGGWKLLFKSTDWVLHDAITPELERGRYLVEALGHCTECHTPRNILGGLKTSLWLSGAPNPTGKGTVPNITAAKLKWVRVQSSIKRVPARLLDLVRRSLGRFIGAILLPPLGALAGTAKRTLAVPRTVEKWAQSRRPGPARSRSSNKRWPTAASSP